MKAWMGIMQAHVVLVRGRGEAVLEPVGGDHVHRTAQELGAFPGGDLAHGREDVGLLGGHLFQGMEGGDIEPPGHPVPVKGRHVVIQMQVVARQAAAHDGGVGGEHGRHRDPGTLDLQQAGARLPLMELGDRLVRRGQVVVVETLDDLPGDITEHGRFLVVPVAGQGIHPESIPEVRQDLVALREEGLVVHQHGDRGTGDVPLAHTQPQPFRGRLLPPRPEQERVLDEIGIARPVHPDIRSD